MYNLIINSSSKGKEDIYIYSKRQNEKEKKKNKDEKKLIYNLVIFAK